MIDVIIVNLNADSQLRDAIQSIAKFHHALVSTIVIVDNASIDESLAQVEALDTFSFPLQIIRNSVNRGFGVACNQGAAQVKSKYLLFLNPDAAIFSNTLPKLLDFMNEPNNSAVGICGVQLLNDAGYVSRSCARFPSASDFVAHSVGINRLFPRFSHFMAEWDHSDSRRVDQVIGAFFLVRREVFDVLHGFDERFFVYFEDLDFSLCAHELGWHSFYLADVQAFHSGGGTSKKIKANRLFYSLRSRLFYAFKHFSYKGAIAILLATLFLEPISRALLALSRCSWSGLKETLAAYGMLWSWLFQWVLKGANFRRL